MRKVQWCVKCKKYHLFDDVNWKYNWKQRTWECLKTEDLTGGLMEDRIKETCDKLYKLLARANETGEKLVAIKNIPVEYLELVINALELKQKYETQWLNDINNPLEPLKLSSALNSEIFKLEYRKANKPEEINILDYTVIAALKDCLERYAK